MLNTYLILFYTFCIAFVVLVHIVLVMPAKREIDEMIQSNRELRDELLWIEAKDLRTKDNKERISYIAIEVEGHYEIINNNAIDCYHNIRCKHYHPSWVVRKIIGQYNNYEDMSYFNSKQEAIDYINRINK